MKILLNQYADFNYWANEKLLTCIENNCNDEMLDRTIESSFNSLRKTIYHIWDAENIWYKRWTGEKIDGWPSKNFTGSFSELKIQMLNNSARLQKFIEQFPNEKLTEYFHYRLMNGTEGNSMYWQSFQHIFNHSTFHRGQLVTMLRQSGVNNLPQTDFIAYTREAIGDQRSVS